MSRIWGIGGERTIEELIKKHRPNDYEDILEWYRECPHETWIDKDTRGFISYFFLEDEEYDMIIVMATDDIFSRAQWRVLAKTLKVRSKEVQINSDSSNTKLQEFAARYGGYFKGEDIVFPRNKEDKKW